MTERLTDDRVREIAEAMGRQGVLPPLISEAAALAREVLDLRSRLGSPPAAGERERWERDFAGREFAVPTIKRAIEDLRWYAERLCVEKPWRYEVYQMRGEETRLSDAIKVVLPVLGVPAPTGPAAGAEEGDDGK